ncbi:MAG TPA: D-sedoheptulose 7-phosphate isomerase [Herpetosiphonaceae bacterium]
MTIQESMGYEAAIRQQFAAHIALAQRVVAEQTPVIERMAEILVSCYRNGHKAIFCGNGGSAADAQHLAAELVGRYLIDRPPLPALALHTDTSAITAIANDYSYDDIFARQAEAHLQPGDVLVALTTSGTSPNVVKAAEVARRKGCQVLGLLGRDGGTILPLCDAALVVPAQQSFLIQEVYMIVGHLLCDLVEQAIFGG